MSEQNEATGSASEPIDTTPKREQASQVEAAVQLAHFLTSRYPQVDDSDSVGTQGEPQLNYYFAGSLATTLLSSAASIDLCSETTGANISVERTMQNTTQTQVALAAFARPIGDIDYVPTTHYKEQLAAVQELYDTVSVDDYHQAMARYLGGKLLTFGDLPSEALPAMQRREEQLDTDGIKCDSVTTYGTNKFARIQIDGHDYYITRPDTLIGYKILHMLQTYTQKPDTFNADFANLYHAMGGLYSEAEMVEQTHHLLNEYEQNALRASAPDRYYISKLPAMTRELLARPELGGEIRSFINNVVAYDQSHGRILDNQAPQQ